jgi:AraC-like DNA-binding protein
MFNSKMFLPDYRLNNWIKVYWFLEGKGLGNNSFKRQILPDGCATIVFVLQGTMNLSIYKNGILKRGIYIVPPVIKPHYDLISDDIRLIDIQLNPSVFYKLFNIPINELENKVYKFNDISLNFDDSIIEKISNAQNNNFLIYSLLNEYLINLFDKLNFKEDDILLNINELYKFGDLNKFFKNQNLSIRQLERKVKTYTGLTPKNLSKIGRFYSILDYMKFREFSIEFTQLAFEHKFADQSHFIREFKSFSNETPLKFIKNSNDYPQYNGLCNLTEIKNYK